MTFFFRYLLHNRKLENSRRPILLKRRRITEAPEFTWGETSRAEQNPEQEDDKASEVSERVEEEEQGDPCLLFQLPTSILADILSRLSFKVVCISRCVSKVLLSVTSSPDFMSLRLDRSDFEIFLRPDSPMRGSRDLHFVDLHGLCDSAPLRGGTTDVRFRVSLPKRRLDMKTPLAAERDYDIANSCNGFMCLRKATMFSSCKNPCIVWNPFTGEFTFIPKPEKENTIKAWPIVSGLGCGARSNVYKVVRLFHGVSPLSPFDRVAEVCTLGSDSWRSIGQAPWDTIYEGSTYTVYLNGVIHWLSEPDGSVAKFSLLCFDFEEEKFNHLPLPPQLLERMGDGPAESKVTLGALRGCLCVSGLVLHRIKVWILRDRSDETSWTPQFSIYNFMGSFFRPLKWLENGSLVMLWSKMSLVFYDRMARTVREFRVRGGGSVAFQAIAHVPNMGSLRDIAGGRNLVVHNGEPIRWRPEDAEAMSLVEDRDVGVNWVFDLWG